MPRFNKNTKYDGVCIEDKKFLQHNHVKVYRTGKLAGLLDL